MKIKGLHYVKWKLVCQPKAAGGLGIHSTSSWRLALLARHAADYLSDKSSLFKQCMVSIYGNSLSNSTFKRNCSPSWRLLLMGFSSLQNCLGWEVVNGLNISFYNDKWNNGRSLAQWPTYINCLVNLPLRVSEVIDDTGQWNANLLHQLCGEDLTHFIMHEPIKNADHGNKAILYRRFSGGSISSLAYLKSYEDEVWEFHWIFKLKLRPRELIFWWRICHDAIPTMEWLVRRGLAQLDSCPWGCECTESLSHILTSCSFLINTIKILWLWNIPCIQPNAMQEAFHLLKYEAGRKLPSLACIAYCYCIYQCWKNRLAKTHGRPVATPLVTAATILANSKYELGSTNQYWGTIAEHGIDHKTLWCPPPNGWLKANFDGSLCENGCGGCGMVIRNDKGDLVAAIGRGFRHWDPGEAELKGLLLLQQCLANRGLECKGLIIEGDNHNVILHASKAFGNLLRKGNTPPDTDLTFLLSFSNVIFLHTHRLCNSLADLSARLARESDFFWEEATATPVSFYNLLLRRSLL